MSLQTDQKSGAEHSGWLMVKVGGSLLNRSDLPQLLTAWLDRQETEKVVLLAGGGELVAAIRQEDAEKKLEQSAAHWLAIQAMQQTAEVLAALLPGVPLVKSLKELRETSIMQSRVVIDAHQFMREEEKYLPGEKLPEHWDVTSDSIAARLAIVLQTRELVLLKSCSPKSNHKTLQALADNGYVDPFFPRLMSELPAVRLVDLPGGREVCFKY